MVARAVSLVALGILAALGGELRSSAVLFRLPTANNALFEPGHEEQFFVGTVGRNWVSGAFGCVRSDGWQMHEGIDIRCLQRDKRGEPVDPVLATADGTVAYLNKIPGLSNYGNYVVLRHRIEGLDVYSLYAHLREIRADLRIGQPVRAGEQVAVMGRTSNTREGISKERAHVHFELGFLVNENFPSWHKKRYPTGRNDHGQWNGLNLIAIDARRLFLIQRIQGPRFSLLNLLRHETELCRVLVRVKDFPWIRRYPSLVRPNPRATGDAIAGYEIALNYNGLPFEIRPRAVSEIHGNARYELRSVNQPEQRKHPCRKLVVQKGGQWELTDRGLQLLELLTY